jgi:asparagine synthase (glutamine-hydrolysing)
LATSYRIDHHELHVSEKDFIGAYEEAILAMEEPRYNASVPAYWLLAQMASKDVTIILNGSGGDELFLGYPRYQNALRLEQKYRNMPAFIWNTYYTLLETRKGFVSPGNMLHLDDLVERWCYVNHITPPASNPSFRFMKGFDEVSAATMLRANDAPLISSPLADETNAIAELDRWFWLANEEFLRTDKIIMHFGMEGRFPFLAGDLIAYANSIPSALKLKNGKKSLVRDAYRGKLPDYILEKRKSGWNAPIGEWMSGEFGSMVREVLTKEYYPPTSDLFDFDELRKRELDGKTQFSKAELMRFLPIVQFQVWARVFGVTLS